VSRNDTFDGYWDMCVKLRKPDLYINELGRRKYISGRGAIVDLSRWWPKVVKFYFTNSKLKKNTFQISKSRESKALLQTSSDAHANE